MQSDSVLKSLRDALYVLFFSEHTVRVIFGVVGGIGLLGLVTSSFSYLWARDVAPTAGGFAILLLIGLLGVVWLLYGSFPILPKTIRSRSLLLKETIQEALLPIRVRLRVLGARLFRVGGYICLAMVASPLVIPLGQFIEYLRDGMWHHLSVVSALQWLAENALQRGIGDPDMMLALLAWTGAPTSWVGLHAILSWVPFLLVAFVVFGLLFGALAASLFEEAKKVQPVMLGLDGAGILVATIWPMARKPSDDALLEEARVPARNRELFGFLIQLYRLYCFYIVATVEFGMQAAQEMLRAQEIALRELSEDDFGDEEILLVTLVERLSAILLGYSFANDSEVRLAIEQKNLEKVVGSLLGTETTNELAKLLLALHPESPFYQPEGLNDAENVNDLDFHGMDASLAQCLDHARTSAIPAFLDLLQDVKESRMPRQFAACA